jgi:hypothetical protein
MFGLLLGFVLRASQMQAGDVRDEAISAGIRSIVWFAAFGLFERVPWSGRERLVAHVAGVAAALLALLATNGITLPSIAGPLWAVMALALGVAAPAPWPWASRLAALRVVPVPLFSALALAFGLFVFLPAALAANAVYRALMNEAQLVSDSHKPPPERQIKQPLQYLLLQVIGHPPPQQPVKEGLLRAEKELSGNVRTRVQLAVRYKQAWAMVLGRPEARSLAEASLIWAARAAEATDKQGLDGFLVEARLRKEMGQAIHGPAQMLRQRADNIEKGKEKPKKGGGPLPVPKKLRADADKLDVEVSKQFELAAEALERCTKLAPTNVLVRYDLADLLYRSAKLEPDPGAKRKRLAAAAAQAEEALRLHGLARNSIRKLPDTPQLRYHLAELFHDAGRPQAAAAQAEEALRLQKLPEYSLRKLAPSQEKKALRWAGAEKPGKAG